MTPWLIAPFGAASITAAPIAVACIAELPIAGAFIVVRLYVAEWRSASELPPSAQRRTEPTVPIAADIIPISPATSILIPKFVSLHGLLVYELRNREDTSKSMILVWLWFRSPHDGLAANDADF